MNEIQRIRQQRLETEKALKKVDRAQRAIMAILIAIFIINLVGLFFAARLLIRTT